MACGSPGTTTRRPRGSSAAACSAHSRLTRPSFSPRTTMVGCSIAGRRSSIRSARTERARVRSWPRLPAHSRPASATSSAGSCAESRIAPKIWWRALRLRGSIVGPTSTIGPTRSGRRTASSVTIWQPIELATNAGRSSPTASSQPPSASARPPIPSGVGDGSLLSVTREVGRECRAERRRGSARAEACSGPRRRIRGRAPPAAHAADVCMHLDAVHLVPAALQDGRGSKSRAHGCTSSVS